MNWVCENLGGKRVGFQAPCNAKQIDVCMEMPSDKWTICQQYITKLLELKRVA